MLCRYCGEEITESFRSYIIAWYAVKTWKYTCSDSTNFRHLPLVPEDIKRELVQVVME